MHAAQRLCRREPFSRPDRSVPDAIRKAAPQDLQALFSAPRALVTQAAAVCKYAQEDC